MTDQDHIARYLVEAADTLQDALDNSVEASISISYDGAPQLAEIISALREATIERAVVYECPTCGEADPFQCQCHSHYDLPAPGWTVDRIASGTPQPRGVLDDPMGVCRVWAMNDLATHPGCRYGVLDHDFCTLPAV